METMESRENGNNSKYKLFYMIWRQYQIFTDKIYPYRFIRWLCFLFLVIFYIYDVIIMKGELK